MYTKETRRQILHILTGIIIILVAQFEILPVITLFFLLILGGLLSLIYKKTEIPILKFFINNFGRNKEIPGKALLMFLAGALLTLKLFNRDIAIASLIILTFADPISNFIGRCFGKTCNPLNKNKNIEGTILGAIIGGILASFIIHPILAFSGSFIAMFLESLTLKLNETPVDDDLLIPIVAGAVMTAIRVYLF